MVEHVKRSWTTVAFVIVPQVTLAIFVNLTILSRRAMWPARTEVTVSLLETKTITTLLSNVIAQMDSLGFGVRWKVDLVATVLACMVRLVSISMFWVVLIPITVIVVRQDLSEENGLLASIVNMRRRRLVIMTKTLKLDCSA